MDTMEVVYFLVVISFLVSVFLFKKSRPKLFFRIIYSLGSFIFFNLCLAYSLIDTYTDEGLNSAVLYHLKYGLTGAGYLAFWRMYILSAFFIFFAFIFSYWLILGPKSKNKKHYVFPAFLILIFVLVFNPLTINVFNFYKEYSKRPTANFYDYYREPRLTEVGEKKNLVYIYAEGLEYTYFDEEIFPGLIKNLKKYFNQGTYFSNMKSLRGTDWTIAGIVSSQCGIPLNTLSGDGNIVDGHDSYLKEAVCLGDLLKDDYYLTYYGGASLTFAGKGDFFRTHGFHEARGKEELLDELEDKSYQSVWGLFDDLLFDISFERFKELSETKDNFALFNLTLDTHHPDGHPSESCQDIVYDDGENSMLNSVACSDYLISRYIDKILHSDYADNTVIVLASDHLGHRSRASGLLNEIERENLFLIIDPSRKEKKEVSVIGSSLDIGSTILPFMGFEADIGLGRNLLDDNISTNELAIIQRNAPLWKNESMRYWGGSDISQGIYIDLDKKRVQIGNNEFVIPVLIKINSSLDANIVSHLEVGEQLLGLKDSEKYILINEDDIDEKKYNIFFGQGKEILSKLKISDNINIERSEIENIMKLSEVGENEFFVKRIIF